MTEFQLKKGLPRHSALQQITDIFSSPIRRCRESAEILSQNLGVSLRLEEGLEELHFGPWEGLSENEIASRYPCDWNNWKTSPLSLNLPGRETLNDFSQRVRDTISKVGRRSTRPLLVTHCSFIRVSFLLTNSIDLNMYPSIVVPNAQPFVIDWPLNI